MLSHGEAPHRAFQDWTKDQISAYLNLLTSTADKTKPASSLTALASMHNHFRATHAWHLEYKLVRAGVSTPAPENTNLKISQYFEGKNALQLVFTASSKIESDGEVPVSFYRWKGVVDGDRGFRTQTGRPFCLTQDEKSAVTLHSLDKHVGEPMQEDSWRDKNPSSSWKDIVRDEITEEILRLYGEIISRGENMDGPANVLVPRLINRTLPEGRSFWKSVTENAPSEL